jgi:pre-mRNA-splicing factor SYF2
MVQTRNAGKSAKDEASAEQIEQPIENTSDTPGASSENKAESKSDDGASKSRDRLERFKALQARAVSGP